MKRRVILHQKVECCFVLVDETAYSRINDFSKILIHHELNRQVAELLKYQTIVHFFLHGRVFQWDVPYKHYQLIKQQRDIVVRLFMFVLPLAVTHQSVYFAQKYIKIALLFYLFYYLFKNNWTYLKTRIYYF